MALLLPLRGLLQNPATERERTYSKSSNREREDVLKFQQQYEDKEFGNVCDSIERV